MKEIFKEVIYNRNYLITSYGRVYSRKSNKFLSPRDNGRGYKSIQIDGKNRYIHRLVAEHFITGDKRLQVNHIDEDKTNNHVDNLEFVTAKQNLLHSYDKIYNKIASVKSETFIVTYPCGKTVTITNLRAFCRENGLHQGSMSHVVHGNRKHHKGYKCRKVT